MNSLAISGKPAVRFYDNYRAHWKNHRQQKRKEYDDIDYYDQTYYDEPAIVKKTGLEAKRPKRESEDVEYVEYNDADYLPAEHRQSSQSILAQNRQSSNPM